MYNVTISQKNAPRPIATVKGKGNNTINTDGLIVDNSTLRQLELACLAWNEVSELEYPANASGAEIHEIDDIQGKAFDRMTELANRLAKTARRA